MTKLRLGLPILALALCASLPTQAGEKEEAKQLFDAGLKLMKVDDFAAAVANFEQSTALFPTQNSLFNLANCYQALRRYEDALGTLERLNRDFGKVLKPEIKSAAARQEAEIRSLAARLTVRVVPSDASVTVDGKVVGSGPTRGPVMLVPGEHVIEASQPGYHTRRVTVQLVSGKERLASLELEPTTSLPPGAATVNATSPMAGGAPALDLSSPESTAEAPKDKGRGLRIVAWSSAGAALAAGAVAGTFWYIANGHFSDYEKYNTGNPDTAQLAAAAKADTKSAGNIAMGCGITAAVLAVTAGITYWLGRDTSTSSSDGPAVSLSPVGVSVTY